MIGWQDSGRGRELTLTDAQQLALDAGCQWPQADETTPLSRRANLPALLDRFGVNSLSAFRALFQQYHLTPDGARAPAGGCPQLLLQPLQQPHAHAHGGSAGGSSATTSGSWSVMEEGAEAYVGQTLNGARHGLGVLLTRGARPSVYVGQFLAGQRGGHGVVSTPRGEGFRGHFLEDVLWGPGVYWFASPARAAEGVVAAAAREHAATGALAAPQPTAPGAADAPASAARGATAEAADSLARRPWKVCFRGMFNGRPAGQGLLTWSDGREEAGLFDGAAAYEQLPPEAVAGVVQVAADNAERAAEAAADAMAALRAQGLWEHAAQLLAAGGWAGGFRAAAAARQKVAVSCRGPAEWLDRPAGGAAAEEQ